MMSSTSETGMTEPTKQKLGINFCELLKMLNSDIHAYAMPYKHTQIHTDLQSHKHTCCDKQNKTIMITRILF